MKHQYSLAHLTALALSPLELIKVAARTGYTYVGLRLNQVTPQDPLYPLIADRGLMQVTKQLLDDTGIKVWDVELARMDPMHSPEDYLPLLEAAAELGARHVLTQLPDPDRVRATERFARICDLAKPLGLGIDLEFPSWTETPNLQSAVTLLNAVDRSNAGIMIDTLHFARSHSSLEQLKSLPRTWFHYAQICDAPAEIPATLEGLLHTARSERLFPGEGGIDVRRILDHMPPNIPYALEIPGNTLAAQIGLEEYARRALQTTKRYLGDK